MRDMGARGLAAAGSFGFVLLALLFLVSVVAASLLGAESHGVYALLVASDYALALLGLVGLAVVPGVLECFSGDAWVRWTGRIAVLGFALIAVMSFWQAEYELSLEGVPGMAAEAPAGMLQEGETPFGRVWADVTARLPQGWLELAGVGLWIFSVSRLARRRHAWPQGLSDVGTIIGVSSFLAAAGCAFDLESLRTVGFAAGMVFLPLWFGGVGFMLAQPEGKPARTLFSVLIEPRKPVRLVRVVEPAEPPVTTLN